MTERVVIVGDGHNGLVCAAYLARRAQELKWSRVMAKCCVVDGAFYTPARRRQTPAPDV